MALNAGTMKASIAAELAANVKPFYTGIADDHTLGGYDIDTYFDKFATAIANAVVARITADAKATGNDSGGDTHNLTII